MDEKLNDKTLNELAEFKEVVEGETIEDPENYQRNGADSDSDESDQADGADGNITPQVRTLKTLIDERAKYFRVNRFEVYATVSTEVGVTHMKITSKNFNVLLSGLALDNDIMPNDSTLNTVIKWCESETLNTVKNIETLHYRKGFDNDGNLWILRSTDPIEYIKVTPKGFETHLLDCPIKIIVNETALPLPLPLPKKEHGDLNILNEYVNLQPQYLPLLHSLLVSSYVLQGEYPLILAQGQHNTGKSTLIKIMYQLLDPNQSQLRGMFSESRNMYTAAAKTHLFGMDNISYKHKWFADAVCQIATGGEVEYKTNYTNDETTIISVCNPIIIGSINPVSTETDFISRAVLLPTHEINKSDRRLHSEFWDSFENDSRTIFTGLLNAISYVLKNRKNTNTKNISRITDFHIVGRTLSSHGLNWEIDFDTAISGSIKETNQQLIEENPIAQLLIMHMENAGLTSMEYTTAKWNAILQSIDDNLNQEEQQFLQEQTKNYESRYLGRVFTKMVEPLWNMGYKFSKRQLDGKSNWKIERISKSHSTDSTHSTTRAENPPSVSRMSSESSVKLNRQDYTGTIFEPKDNKNG